MVKRADVLVENFAPGVTERLGLGVEAMHKINPRLVYAQSSGYGQEGLYRDYPAMDLTVQAMSGVMGITGFPEREPVKAGPALCDFFAGVHLYGGIVTALLDRERTGRGRTVEVAMLDAVYASLSSTLGMCFGSAGRSRPHRQPPRRARRVAVQRLPDQRRLHRDHLRRRAALERPARRDGPQGSARRSALRRTSRRASPTWMWSTNW